MYLQALNMRKKLLGAEHPSVARNLNNLAWLYQYQGNIASAVQYLKRDLEVQEKNLTYNLAAGAESQKAHGVTSKLNGRCSNHFRQ